MTRSFLPLAIALALAAPSAAFAQAAAPPRSAGRRPPDARLAGFDTYVDAVRKQFDVPGIAVAIVEGDRIVYERGFGPREIGKPRRWTSTRCSPSRPTRKPSPPPRCRSSPTKAS
jgi:CubicO group peptidase (beta-lactamase class C family)